MAAKWSLIWDEYKGGFTSRRERDGLLHQARYTCPTPAKTKKGGKYPHLQPFFKYVEVKNG